MRIMDKRIADPESCVRLVDASAGNRTRGWPTFVDRKISEMATANFTTKPPMHYERSSIKIFMMLWMRMRVAKWRVKGSAQYGASKPSTAC